MFNYVIISPDQSMLIQIIAGLAALGWNEEK